MVCVDTSVWIEAFRRPESPYGVRLRRMLDDAQVLLPIPVRHELLSGAPASEFARLRVRLSALPVATPDSGTWARIDRWLATAVQRHLLFGFADLLIAALARDNDAPLWSLDPAFHRMAQLDFLRILD